MMLTRLTNVSQRLSALPSSFRRLATRPPIQAKVQPVKNTQGRAQVAKPSARPKAKPAEPTKAKWEKVDGKWIKSMPTQNAQTGPAANRSKPQQTRNPKSAHSDRRKQKPGAQAMSQSSGTGDKVRPDKKRPVKGSRASQDNKSNAEENPPRFQKRRGGGGKMDGKHSPGRSNGPQQLIKRAARGRQRGSFSKPGKPTQYRKKQKRRIVHISEVTTVQEIAMALGQEPDEVLSVLQQLNDQHKYESELDLVSSEDAELLVLEVCTALISTCCDVSGLDTRRLICAADRLVTCRSAYLLISRMLCPL